MAHLAAVSFFPTTLAGPITRVGQLLPQWEKPKMLSAEDGGMALFLIGTGLAKKLLIADYLAGNLVNRVFDLPKLYSAFEVLIAVYGYALQLYYDFSGYSDIAIGSALLLGIKLPVNFNSPYCAHNIADFWRRWHISLSNWLRDYLYFSLPGLRSKRKAWTYGGLIVTMLLGGLWHGASWTFVIWGLLHGIALALQRGWQVWRGNTPAPQWWARTARTFFTVQFVCFAWIFFRAGSLNNAFEILERLASFTFSTVNIRAEYWIVLLLAAFVHYAPTGWHRRCRELYSASPFYAQAAAMLLLVIAIEYVAQTGAAPFIIQNSDCVQKYFPVKPSLAIATFTAMMIVPEFIPQLKNLKPLEWKAVPLVFDFVPGDLASARGDESEHASKASEPLSDPARSLDPFYGALRRADTANPGAVALILHYGDSPATADLITSDARDLLQERFGNAGHGFHLIAKPWAWYEHRGVRVSNKGWSIDPATQPSLADGVYGLGGVSFRGTVGAHATFRIHESGHNRLEL